MCNSKRKTFMISVNFLTSDKFVRITNTQKTIEKFDRRPLDYREKSNISTLCMWVNLCFQNDFEQLVKKHCFSNSYLIL